MIFAIYKDDGPTNEEPFFNCTWHKLHIFGNFSSFCEWERSVHENLNHRKNPRIVNMWDAFNDSSSVIDHRIIGD